MKIKKLIIKKKETPNELDYLFTKIQACYGEIIIELRLINQFLKKLKERNISITDTNFMNYLEKRYPNLEKEISKFNGEYINKNHFNKLKMNFYKIKEDNNTKDKNQDNNIKQEETTKRNQDESRKDDIFDEEYFKKHHSSFLNS